jgi:RNA polymerase sigma-70 factor (ECF subfamily)
MDRYHFEIMAQRVRPKLVATARRIVGDNEESEDLSQETLLRLWTIRDKIDGYDSPDALAHVILKNLCLMKLRHEGTIRSHSQKGIETAHAPIPHEELEEKENDIWFHRELEDLPPGQMAIMQMKQVEDMSITDIAKTLAISEEAVRQQLSKARKKLLRHYQERR